MTFLVVRHLKISALKLLNRNSEHVFFVILLIRIFITIFLAIVTHAIFITIALKVLITLALLHLFIFHLASI